MLQGSKGVLARKPAPVWFVENGITENFGGINPFFSGIFELFWEAGYRSKTVDRCPRDVTPADVARWVEQRGRDFGGINYVFERFD